MTDSQALRGLQTSACATLILLKSVIKGGKNLPLSNLCARNCAEFFVCLFKSYCLLFFPYARGPNYDDFPFYKDWNSWSIS